MLNRKNMTKRAYMIEKLQSEDGEEYKGRPAHPNQEHLSSRRFHQTTTNASSIPHTPTLTCASHRCSRYERNASQVNVMSEARVWWPSIVEISRYDACSKQNLWTNRFVWARHVNNCKEWRLHADAVKPLSHEVSSRAWPQALLTYPQAVVG